MENIDEFMRQKFDSDDPGERFEFQEEYWEQAQALLEREEARRRRRLWLFIGLVLALALLVWLLVVQWQTGSLSQNKAGEKNLNFSTKKSELQSNTNDKLTSVDEGVKSSAFASTVDGTARRDEKLSKIPDPEGNLSGKTTTVKAENSRREITRRGGQAASMDEQALIASKSGQTRATQKGIAQSNDVEKNQGKNRELSKGGKTSKSASDFESPQQIQGGNNNAENAQNPENDQSPVTTPPVTTSPVIIPLITIPTPLTPFPLPERVVVPRKLPVRTKEPIAEKIKPVQDQRLSLGLSVAGTAFRPADNNDRWAGWIAGIFGDYRLNKNWSLMLGAQARFVPGYAAPEESSNPVEIEQLRYSFGYNRETWQRETRGLHYLEIPFSARWHKAAWSLEAGAAAGRLLWVQNRTEHTVESSLVEAKTTVNKFEKGITAPYHRTYYSAFAGAVYCLNDRVSLMTRAQYRFTPVFKTLGEGVKNIGLGNVELGLRVRLF